MQESMQAQTTFDRFHASIDGLPGVTTTKPSAIKQALPLVGSVSTVTVQTFKGKEFGFTIAMTVVDADGMANNFILPNKVALAIYRQRQSLADRSTPASRARRQRSRQAQRRRQDKAERRARYAANH